MRESLTLSAKEQQRSETVSRWLAGVVTTDEAVALLGTSERTAWRLRAHQHVGLAAPATRHRTDRSCAARSDSCFVQLLRPCRQVSEHELVRATHGSRSWGAGSGC